MVQYSETSKRYKWPCFKEILFRSVATFPEAGRSIEQVAFDFESLNCQIDYTINMSCKPICFQVEYAKSSHAKCKGCANNIDKDDLRLAKVFRVIVFVQNYVARIFKKITLIILVMFIFYLITLRLEH